MPRYPDKKGELFINSTLHLFYFSEYNVRFGMEPSCGDIYLMMLIISKQSTAKTNLFSYDSNELPKLSFTNSGRLTFS